MLVSPPPISVPRWIVTNSRKMLWRPITQPRRLAAVLQVLRHQADRREREDLRVVADLGPAVDDGRRADPAVPADPHVRADRRVRPDRRAFADLGAGMNDGAWIDLGRPPQLEQQVRFGHDLLVDVRDAVHARQRPAVAPERHLEPQTIARHDLPAELRVVDAAQVDADGRRAPASSSSTVEACASASIISTPGMSGAPGKVPLKELLVDRDVLDRHQAASGLVLQHHVQQVRRVAVRQAVDERRDVNGHGQASGAVCRMVHDEGAADHPYNTTRPARAARRRAGRIT